MIFDAIERVTRALKKRLEEALADVAGGGVVFVGPLNDSSVGDAALILFPYRIAPNAGLRNSEHSVRPEPLPPPPPQPPVIVHRNSLPLDVYFLVTVGEREGSEEVPLSKLGAAMQALQADPDLVGPEVRYETVHMSLEPLTTEELSRVWALFPTANYRTSVAYVASPVWIDPRVPSTGGARVVRDTLLAGHRA